jgi:hypothetical protein
MSVGASFTLPTWIVTISSWKRPPLSVTRTVT